MKMKEGDKGIGEVGKREKWHGFLFPYTHTNARDRHLERELGIEDATGC